jgi:type II secretory pathway pseudopilin PulG
VVLLILSILATISATVYTGYITRTHYAVARTDIRTLEMAASRYQVDLGSYPLSSSGDSFGAAAPVPILGSNSGTLGCGYLMLCLLQSYSGDSKAPASPRWFGPYMDIDVNKLGAITNTGAIVALSGGTPLPRVNMLDPWGNPYYFVRNEDYTRLGATEQSGLPFVEPFYNPSTVQIFSLGKNGRTIAPPQAGLDDDDVNNFNMP